MWNIILMLVLSFRTFHQTVVLFVCHYVLNFRRNASSCMQTQRHYTVEAGNLEGAGQWMPHSPQPAAVERDLAAVELGTYWAYIMAIADSRPSRVWGSPTRLPPTLLDSRPSRVRVGRGPYWTISARLPCQPL